MLAGSWSQFLVTLPVFMKWLWCWWRIIILFANCFWDCQLSFVFCLFSPQFICYICVIKNAFSWHLIFLFFYLTLYVNWQTASHSHLLTIGPPFLLHSFPLSLSISPPCGRCFTRTRLEDGSSWRWTWINHMAGRLLASRYQTCDLMALMPPTVSTPSVLPDCHI